MSNCPEEAFGPLAFVEAGCRLLHAFQHYRVRFVIVGGFAVRFHGHLRRVADLDLFIDVSLPNLALIRQALLSVGGTSTTEIDEFGRGRVIWRWRDGTVDRFVDLMALYSPFGFDQVYGAAVHGTYSDLRLRVVSKDQLIENKRLVIAESVHRDVTRDLQDVWVLSGHRSEPAEGRKRSP